MATNNLVSFYKEGTSQPQLSAGKYEGCKLIDHKLVETNPKNPYIALVFETKLGRKLTENRFNQGFQIFVSHLKQQLGMADKAVDVQDFLKNLVEDKTEFTIWITKYTPEKGQTRSNFNFIEPREPKAEDSAISETTAEEVEDAI